MVERSCGLEIGRSDQRHGKRCVLHRHPERMTQFQ